MERLINFGAAWVVKHPKVAVAISALVSALVAAVTQDLTDWLGELSAAAD